MKLPIKIGSKQYWMDSDSFQKEKNWRKEAEKSLHKNLVQIFK